MERVRKFWIWARSELGIGHDVWRAFRTGGIRTWGRNRAAKTNRLVGLSVGLSVTLVNPAKTAAPIEMPFPLRTRMGPRNHALVY